MRVSEQQLLMLLDIVRHVYDCNVVNINFGYDRKHVGQLYENIMNQQATIIDTQSHQKAPEMSHKDFHQETTQKIWEGIPFRKCPTCREEIEIVEKKVPTKAGHTPTSILMVRHHNDQCNFEGSLGEWLESVLGPEEEFLGQYRAREKHRTYYCEQCFHILGELKVMRWAELSNPPGYECPQCHERWRLNRGQARHLIALKLAHYDKLAKQLSVLEEQL